MTIKAKLTAGFGVLALIIVGLGITSFYLAGGVARSSEQISHASDEMQVMSDVADRMTGAFQAHKDWLSKVETCMFENAETLDVTMDGHKCGLGKFIYGEKEHDHTGLARLSEVAPELAQNIEAIKDTHLKLHATAHEMNELWAPRHEGLTDELKDRLDDHRRWVAKVADGIIAGEKCDVECDPQKCGFGRFLSSEQNRGIEEQWPEYAALMEKVRGPHAALHESVNAINAIDADSEDGFEKRRDVYESQTVGELQKIAKTFGEIMGLEQGIIDNQHATEAIFKEKSRPLAEGILGALTDVNSGLGSLRAESEEHEKRLLLGQKQAIAIQNIAIWIAMVVGVVFALVVGVVVIRGITKPLKLAVNLANAMAAGDMTQRLNMKSSDEIGELANALDQSAEGLSAMLSRVKVNAESMAASSEELSATSTQLSAGAEEMTNQSSNVAGATEQMSTNINTMASGAEEMSVNVQGVSSTAEQMSQNMNAVASAIEEMTVAINDIAKNAKEGARISAEAMDKSQSATDTMGVLGDAAGQIGEVTEVIKRIAEQTNLLALNATIEAASAGDAGKGFAVVANEIKELANQSAQAAEDIAKRIAGVQTNTEEAVTVIADVSSVISTINEAVSVITEAVDQQMKTAHEISSNVQQANSGVANIASSVAEVAKGTNDVSKNVGEAAKGANEVATNIQNVNSAAADAAAGAQEVSASAENLEKIASELQAMVDEFKVATSERADFDESVGRVASTEAEPALV